MVADEREAQDRLRIDRWLWCTRLFKTRTLAAHAVRAGHVRLNGERVKAARDVKVGDSVTIASDRGDDSERDLTITAIPLRRGPAPEALACYTETAQSLERRRVATERRAFAVAPPTQGRPDKRTRRLLMRARQRGTVSEE